VHAQSVEQSKTSVTFATGGNIEYTLSPGQPTTRAMRGVTSHLKRQDHLKGGNLQRPQISRLHFQSEIYHRLSPHNVVGSWAGGVVGQEWKRRKSLQMLYQWFVFLSPGLCENVDSITYGILNTVALTGAPVTLYCASDPFRYCGWFRLVDEGLENEGLVNLCSLCERCVNVLPPFVFKPTPQGCNLVIPSASFKQAGLYTAAASGFSFVGAQLFILGRIFNNV